MVSGEGKAKIINMMKSGIELDFADVTVDDFAHLENSEFCSILIDYLRNSWDDCRIGTLKLRSDLNSGDSEIVVKLRFDLRPLIVKLMEQESF